ncbi:hypothetical protein FH972_020970 [Carpinus fangiana]|uniref:Amino acid transporter transmembrane domain-containing protein n=1 Tax=Carpinus fangiana TaxID=176857 RepID=A0A5N6KNJ6_9ROSI|nr:hypothetical protein FH972_020970 [Carpinus fangiana]
MSKPSALALDGPDPRLHPDAQDKYTKPQLRKLHDPSVTFEEYHYYALQTRAEETSQIYGPTTKTTGILSVLLPSKSAKGANISGTGSDQDGPEKDGIKANISAPSSHTTVSDEEWAAANRALRTASRGAIFYLTTTDILGPFGLPFAFATMGWGPGVALYTVFAGMAGYSGYLLYQVFLGLDSYQFPLKSYGDLGYRLGGNWLRFLFNILQGIQLLLNVGLIVISNGEALSQATKFRLCFIVCCLVWTLVGFFVGQIRTLQKFGWLANAAVWLNLMCMFITMGAAAHTLPNYRGASQAAGATFNNGISITPSVAGIYPPVMTTGGLPDTSNFIGSVSGAMQAIFAYGGAMLFPEFMSEMKRPKDFLTAMWAAQAFIYVVYMVYGLFMYSQQGQYSVNPSYLGIGPYNLQTAGNVFAMLSAVIAAALYGNIGIKVLYTNVFVEIFRAPPLTTTPGKIAWAALIPIYWSIAFVVAAGIPNFSGLTSVVSAFCILHFTYTFPPLLSVLYLSRRDALLNGETGFDPATGAIRRQDSGLRRFMRGFLGRNIVWNVLNVLYFLGALCLGALGAYSAIESLVSAFAENTTSSFVCKSPLDG